jgi:hypothetical protein
MIRLATSHRMSCAPPHPSGLVTTARTIRLWSLQDYIVSVEPIATYSDHQRAIQATKFRPHASHQFGWLQIPRLVQMIRYR